MADKRHPFRFRLPWLAAERPAAQSQRRRPTAESPQLPWRPTAAVPSEQSASRPRRQPQLPPKAEPQSSSPTPAQPSKTSPPSTISKPPSPLTTTTKSSPSRAATETTHQPTSPPKSVETTKPPSPSSAATEVPKADSQSTSTTKVPSPSREATEPSKSTSPPSRVSSSSKQPPATPVAAKLASPSHAGKESPKANLKSASAQPSPSRTTSSQLASPSTQAKTRSRATSVASSPSKGDSKSKTYSAPPSPSRSNSQAQSEPSKSSQPESPTRLVPQKTTTSEGSPSRKATQKEEEITASIASQFSLSPHTQPSVAREEPKKAISKEPLQEPESKVALTSAPAKSSSSQDDAMERKRTDVSSPEKSLGTSKVIAVEFEPQELESSVGRDDQKIVKSKENEEMKEERVQELPIDEKNQRAPTYEEPMQKVIIEMPSSEKDSRDIHVGEFKATKGQQKLEASMRKETFATTSYIGKQIKTVIPSLPTEGSTSLSFQNPVEEATPRQREIKEDISKLVQKLTTGAQLDENQVTVITLTGENRGASMLLSSDQVKKEASIHIHRAYKTDPDESIETTTDEEARNNRKRFDAQMAPQPEAYVNSNTQGINNSIVVEASLVERNPGVHFFLSQNTSEAIKANGTSELIQTRKAECTAATSERLTHEPTVRRRCLRGLFMESSDSDLDNPNKARRHGCRYSCGQKNKDKEFM